MADVPVTYSQAFHMSRLQMRATIAAALIASNAVDLSNVFFSDPTTAPNSPSMQKLKQGVDVIMNSIVSA